MPRSKLLATAPIPETDTELKLHGQTDSKYRFRAAASCRRTSGLSKDWQRGVSKSTSSRCSRIGPEKAHGNTSSLSPDAIERAWLDRIVRRRNRVRLPDAIWETLSSRANGAAAVRDRDGCSPPPRYRGGAVKALHERFKNLKLMQDEDIAILDRLHRKTADYPAGCIVQREKGRIELTRIVVSGWAVRFHTTPDGHRQIVNFLLPGDSIGLYGALFPTSDSGVETITEATLAEFASAELMDVFRESARLGAAPCWIGGQDERFLEQQIVRIGALNATTRIAHLLVELQLRLFRGGTRPTDASSMPLTQKLIGEALGVSHVHANRCCRALEKKGLIETAPGSLTLLDPGELKKLCCYDGDIDRAQIPDASVRRLMRSAG